LGVVDGLDGTERGYQGRCLDEVGTTPKPVVNTSDVGPNPSLPTQEAISAGNVPGTPTYAIVSGKPNGKKKGRLLDNDGNPLVPTGIMESDSEVEVDSYRIMMIITPYYDDRLCTRITFVPGAPASLFVNDLDIRVSWQKEDIDF
ncbi:hypothetical protein Tco_1295678, partial [Tanacetum coccineum]